MGHRRGGLLPLTEEQEGRRSAHILVVDDEPLLRALLAEALRDQGFMVTEAANADEALTYYRSDAQIDLVFTDVRMPGTCNGLALARTLHVDNEFLPIVVSSGYLGDERVDDIFKFISKPYHLDAAVALVFSSLGIERRGRS